jgi:hypothetical protein
MPLQNQDAAVARFDDEPRIEVEVGGEEKATAEELCPSGPGPSAVLKTAALTQAWESPPKVEAEGVEGIPVEGIPAEEEGLGFGSSGSPQLGLVEVVALPV